MERWDKPELCDRSLVHGFLYVAGDDDAKELDSLNMAEHDQDAVLKKRSGVCLGPTRSLCPWNDLGGQLCWAAGERPGSPERRSFTKIRATGADFREEADVEDPARQCVAPNFVQLRFRSEIPWAAP